ncbi:MAG: hypothetical protein IPO41_14420 [Acidobacteria bacterium]|nr:hypothetical protein [Acidobacteriota bacterium]MBP7475858.1 hypothetical protein [Pyrinomonadaceae bacterium]MBP9110262.1 hypothetical protein [Pyrinomonadaceae bacterium]
MRSLVLLLLFATFSYAQTAKPKATPTKIPPGVPVKAGTEAKSILDKGTVVGRTYRNETFGFEVTFPEHWTIAGDDFEVVAKRLGFDLSLKAPTSLKPVEKNQLDRALKRVNIFLTAYRTATENIAENAIIRISIEDLTANPQIKDAVDYLDAVRATYATMKLPPDFRYSETQAEKLGAKQFGYLGTSSDAGMKRMYATVKGRYAVMFTLSYKNNHDLDTFRNLLALGNFNL